MTSPGLSLHKDYLRTEASVTAIAEPESHMDKTNVQDPACQDMQPSCSPMPDIGPEFPAMMYREEQPPINVELTRFATLARGVLRNMHLRLNGELLKLLRRATIERLGLREAAAAGLTVTVTELQTAADAFRLKKGLSSTDEFYAWLDRERLSPADFEEALHINLMRYKLRNHLTDGKVAFHFDANPTRYDRAHLCQIVLGQRDFAIKLKDEIVVSIDSFSRYARDFSLERVSAIKGGDIGLRFRHMMHETISEVIFGAVEKSLVGPLAIGNYQYLFLVITKEQANLDRLTEESIREELFSLWVAEQSNYGLYIDPELQRLL